MTREVATTAELVARNAAQHGEVLFLLFYDETVTYADLDRRSDAVAARLGELGVRKGDVGFMAELRQMMRPL